MSEKMIEVSRLQKSFKHNHVLKDVSFTVDKGSIFALLGSNGAGKTTVVKILSTLLKSDGGSASINGLNIATQSDNVRSCISLTGQFVAVDEVLTGRENLMLIGQLKRLPSLKSTVNEWLSFSRLEDAANRKVSTYEVNRQANEAAPQCQTPKQNLFNGLVVCQDCGKTMTARRSYYTHQDGEKVTNLSYHCRTFSVTAGSACSSHAISELELKGLVLGAVHQFAAQISLDESAMLKSLTRQFISANSISKADAQKEVRRLRQELRKLEAAMATLYEDWACGALTESIFSQRMGQYEAQRRAKEQRLSLLEQTEQQSLERQAADTTR